MKRAFAIALATTAIVGVANAADLNSGGYKDSASPVFTNQTPWTGFYFGINAGAGWAQLDSTFADSGTLGGSASTIGALTQSSVSAITPWDLAVNHTNAATGALGGGQLGYNFQTGALVLGVEADFGYLGVSQTRDIISASLGSTNVAVGTKIDSGFLADVTGRLGYASGPALFYAKGGWAYFDGKAGTDGISALATTVSSTDFGDVSKSGLNGWVIGGGLEYLVSPAWSIKAEYLHYDFGSFDLQPITVAGNTVPAITNTLTVDTVKVGLNYHVGATYAPLK